MTSTHNLKKLLAAEINKALGDLTCKIPESTTAPPYTDPPSLSQLEELVGRIEDKLNTFSNDSPSLGRIEETIGRIAEVLNGSVIAGILERLDKIEEQMKKDAQFGLTRSQAAGSCSEILRQRGNSPSGFYWVENAAGHPRSVYCDMTKSCGGITGGWMRITELDMTNSSHQCPSGLRQRNDVGIRTCGINSNSPFCSSVILPSNAFYFSRVCGRIKGYQVGSPDTFGNSGQGRSPGINGNYVDGVSLTHGNPKQHIWTFAAGLDELHSTYPQFNCPCTDINLSHLAVHPPSFVGNDYFCDTGSPSHFNVGTFYRDDPLWDGAGCGPLNSCCSFNTPPWFYKQLPQPTIDDIEMRVCRDEGINNEDVAIEVVEIFIQ